MLVALRAAVVNSSGQRHDDGDDDDGGDDDDNEGVLLHIMLPFFFPTFGLIRHMGNQVLPGLWGCATAFLLVIWADDSSWTKVGLIGNMGN